MDTPICDFVQRYSNSNSARLHMPGHKGASLLGCEAIDITEISGADSLYEANGIIRQSEENAGRIERYRFFNELCSENNIKKIAVAHNKNDSVETVIFNMIRGSSLKGLCGIRYVNGNIIRPILDISREEIEIYLNKNK